MRGGPLSNPAVVKLLQPFVVTAWHGPGEQAMTPEVKEKILGLNAARLYGIDIAARKKALAGSPFSVAAE